MSHLIGQSNVAVPLGKVECLKICAVALISGGILLRVGGKQLSDFFVGAQQQQQKQEEVQHLLQLSSFSS